MCLVVRTYKQLMAKFVSDAEKDHLHSAETITVKSSEKNTNVHVRKRVDNRR